MEPADETSRDRDAAASLNIFAFLWAWFALFHNGNGGLWGSTDFSIFMTIAAVAVLANPARLSNFLVLVLVQLALFIDNAPDLVNHAWFAVVVNLTILAAVLREAIRRPGRPLEKAALYATFAPVLRVMVAILYFYAVFHKLNRDYFLLEYSAAVEHYENLSAAIIKLGLPALPMVDWAKYGAIYGTLVIELAIPMLVLIPRTRILGIWVGLLFHYVLSVEDFYDFSAMAYALLFLFAPSNFPTELGRWWEHSGLKRLRDRLAESTAGRTIPGPFWVALAAVGVMSAFDLLDERWSFRTFKVLWVFYGAAVIVAFAGAIHGKKAEAPSYRPGFFRFASAVFLNFPLLVVLNGAAPYLGLKTRSVFAMFSNLRTEGGTTNHLIVPSWVQIADYQKDMVRVLESSEPDLQRMADRGYSVPFYNLRLSVSAKATRGVEGIRLVFERNGERVELDRAELDPELSKPPSLLERKLLLFGPINPGPHQKNRH